MDSRRRFITRALVGLLVHRPLSRTTIYVMLRPACCGNPVRVVAWEAVHCVPQRGVCSYRKGVIVIVMGRRNTVRPKGFIVQRRNLFL